MMGELEFKRRLPSLQYHLPTKFGRVLATRRARIPDNKNIGERWGSNHLKQAKDLCLRTPKTSFKYRIQTAEDQILWLHTGTEGDRTTLEATVMLFRRKPSPPHPPSNFNYLGSVISDYHCTKILPS